MKQHLTAAIAAVLVTVGTATAREIVATETFSWHGDTITQGEYMATAPNAFEIVSTYSAQPGYKFPIEKTWRLRNDISSYPQLTTPNTLHQAIYNMGLDEMINAVEPDTTLRTGKEWGGVWTRDVSYSILLSMAAMQPEAARISLMKKVNPNGVIIQDTGSGGAWPISSDREIWAVAAWEVYRVTGDHAWLEYIYPIIKKSLEDDSLTVASANGLVKGETSFIDWREQSHPRWMQTADIAESETLSTSVVHAEAWRVLARAARALGHEDVAAEATARADAIDRAINSALWLDGKGYYAMYIYGRNNPIINPRAETLGASLAILYGTASPERARTITESNPTTPFGVGNFFPQIADMPSYHNNSLWPWVGSYWALANARAGNEQGTLEAIANVFRPAALFATNKENYRLDNGDIATELNSSNMLWCLAGNIAITQRILFGIEYEDNGLAFKPFVPRALGADRSLSNYRYRNATLDINISGYGDSIASFTLNGRPHEPFLPADLTGRNTVDIRMSDTFRHNLSVNHSPNIFAPLTPLTRFEGNTLAWNPIEYIGSYKVLRDGEVVATTRNTTFDASVPGEYQVIGVATDGTEGFASEPLRNTATVTAEMPGEGTAMTSTELVYPAESSVTGFNGTGFVEIDRTTAPLTVSVDIPEDGVYAVTYRYANGNGPVNTENRAAIRTLSVDGNRAGVVVFPHRGTANWFDWGRSTAVRMPLTAGTHSFTIDYRPENTNMNIDSNYAIIDRIVLEKVR